MREINYFVDSNIFLRPMVKDDAGKTKDCILLFKKISEGKINAFTSNLVLAEIVWVTQSFYKIKKRDIIKALRAVLEMKNLKIIDNFDPFIALEIFKKCKVKFIDALIGSNPGIFKKEIVVVSYDKDFDKIGILRKEPRQLIK